MKFAAKIKDIGRTLSGNMTITLESQHMDVSAAMELSKLDSLEVEIKKYRKKRSLDANAYYWKLLSKLAEVSGISKNRAHNLMLSRYGQMEEYDGHLVYVVVPDTPEGAEMALEAETYHIKPTSEVQEGTDGTLFRTYKMLKGSSVYDTKEMSYLINGLVGECKELGIETLSPTELERIMAAYEQIRHKKNKNAG